MSNDQAPAITEVDYEQSPTLAKFAEALAAAQLEMDNAEKASENPHFNARYADLADVINACREPLAKNKIARIQTPRTRASGEVGLRTALVHASDEYVAFTFWCKPERTGPQALGSVLTYLRRYGLAAVVGVGQEDDDGNAGQGSATRPPPAEPRAAAQGKPAAKAQPPAKPPEAPKPVDAEHADNIKEIRNTVGDLKWEDKNARNWMRGLFGVDVPAFLSKPQSLIARQLVYIAHTQGEDAMVVAIKKAKEQSPELFVSQKGAAA
jgi:hypothetical protein